MEKVRNILLIGIAGKGKSTLANVLAGTDEFEESTNHINGTDKIKTKEFEHEGIRYRVVDTVGIGISTAVSTGEILSQLEDKSDILCEGIIQILFVTNCRFTKEEVETFDLLSNAIFDNNVTNFTTIVCTGFPKFENKKACEMNRKEFQEEIAKRSIPLASTATIYVDNPPMKGYYVSVAKIPRAASRKILLKHLKSCKEIYQPEPLTKFSKMVDEFNSIIEDTTDAIDNFELHCNNNIKCLKEFIFKRENLLEMIKKRRKEVQKIMEERFTDSTISHSVILIGKALAISGFWFPPALVPGVALSAVGLLGTIGAESVAIIKENESYQSFEDGLEEDKEKCKQLKVSQEELREYIKRFKTIHLRFMISEYRKQNIDKKRIKIIENVMTAVLGEEIETDGVVLEKNEENKHSTGLKVVRATIENICKIVPSPLSFYCMYRDREEIESRTSLNDMDKTIQNWEEELEVFKNKEKQLTEVYKEIKRCKEEIGKERLNVNEKDLSVVKRRLQINDS